MPKKALILGVNGFIGSTLTERILRTTDWEVSGMDMASDKLEGSLGNPKFQFVEGDITVNKEFIEYQIKKCDVILPLVAIATPALYVSDPVRVFELDFEANLEIVRQCLKYKKHLVFPSTSEVYGMSGDKAFDEELTNFVLGPIKMQRWIYSCSKQLLDRLIYAYGKNEGLQYTLFRPFNWVGPKLDQIVEHKEGSSRVVTQFIANIIHGEDILLVDQGEQRRCFTDIEDGINALMLILENKNGCADSQIFNVGNPDNDYSIRELAETLLHLAASFPGYEDVAAKTAVCGVDAIDYYGEGYQDIVSRVPCINRAKEILGWTPTVGFEECLKKTLSHHLSHPSQELDG